MTSVLIVAATGAVAIVLAYAVDRFETWRERRRDGSAATHAK